MIEMMERSLKRSYNQMDRLISQSEKAYKVNHLEQFEAYQECIEFQQKRIIEIIKELNSII